MAPSFPVELTGQRVSKKLSQSNYNQTMGKTRKVSKGNTLGFIPDYRHAVETMDDSEGFHTEMTNSEESYPPRRKTNNSNQDSYQQFGVPIQVISLSKLSSFGRKELVTRLKRELEQVRTFQKNIATISTNIVSLSPSSGVHSCSAGQRRPFPSVPATHSKKRPGGARSKKSNFDSSKKSTPPVPGNPMLMKQCETLLNRLMSHNFGWVFNTPVDVVSLNIPDYYTVIKRPMDLGTVKTKLLSGNYVDPWGFAADVRLTFSNALTYNPRGNDVHIMAETMSKFFEVRWKPIEKKLALVPMRQNVLEETETIIPMRRNVVEEIETILPMRRNVAEEIETVIPMPPFKKKKTTYLGNELRQEVPVKRTMSEVEKLKLGSELESTLGELPDSIIDFLRENSSNGNQMDDEIEIDLESLPDETLFELRKLLDDFYEENQKNMAKAETCEIELHNEPGFSNNSSMQACQDNDANEEEIDIGGDELPITSFPPIEIEKDTNIKNSKCNSSSSSSSGSGSSSSESDSDSDSDGESAGAKVTAIISNIKDTLETEANIEQTTDVNRDAEDCVNGTGENVPDSQPIRVSSEVEECQEGESGPSERKVSPDKLYRAALLRSRFADTILKAQEKTTGKIEKEDIERLRLEKEELEKRRKQEEARLQAEAKAAEEAKRKADLEAAAEAKRNRELEREAARQALQKMEKVVEINDSSQFLQDLEMLTVTAPAQPLQQTFMDETCEEDDPLSSFNFNNGNGNPLEQLGLYMKNDDNEEEDEEIEPQNAPIIQDDQEEGEIN